MKTISSYQQNWKKATYAIEVDPKLEDVSGNTPVDLFDLEGAGRSIGSKDPLMVYFQVK